MEDGEPSRLSSVPFAMERPELPPGYRARTPRDEDAEAIAEVVNAHCRHFIGENDCTDEEIRLE